MSKTIVEQHIIDS